MRERLEQLRREGLTALSDANSEQELRELEVRYLGRSGALTEVLKGLGQLDAEERPLIGKLANEVKTALGESMASRRGAIKEKALARELSGEGFDASLPGSGKPAGAVHPLTQVRWDLEDLASSMGFMIVDGPEVETEANNFDALNIPADHPARESHDTIWVEGEDGEGGGLCFRTHTSPVQIRALREYGAPLRVVAPGRVFRQETQDATHDHTFYQMEGLVVDRGVGVPHMLHAMETLIEGLFDRPLETRLRPGYFPFVEPGFEMDARCPFCEEGCRICSQTSWIELMPGGLVHPRVLEAGGVDSAEFSGYAFGLGLSRVAMLRYGIEDIRWMFSGDLRFLEQFKA